MDEVFAGLLKLPCWYCNYYFSCTGKANERVEDDGSLSECDDMDLNPDMVLDGCKAYFEYIKSKRKNEKSS